MKSYYRYTFLQTCCGLHFSAPPPSDLLSRAYLESKDPEDIVCSVLAHAQAGDFGQFGYLAKLMLREDQADIWGACAMLFSYAAPGSALRRLLATFREAIDVRPDGAVQQWMCEILCNSGLLWTVPEVLRIFRLNQEREKFFSTPGYLSYLLEHERGPIDEGPPLLRDPNEPDWYDPPPVYDDDAYEALVMTTHWALAARLSNPDHSAVFEGEPLSLVTVAKNLLRRIRSNQDIEEVALGRMILEAQTGIDCSAFYDDNRLKPLAAGAIVESFLESPAAARFEPGVRYFFGHRIPD